MNTFAYDTAFSRNLGILSSTEQKKVSEFKIALAGMGGVGGEYLISLVRIGFQNFRICDIDNFELVNFNRQFGANQKSLNQPKTHTMKQMALDINPNCHIEVVDEAITNENVADFVSGCDLIIDGIDFFVLDAHECLITEGLKQDKVVLAAVPFGFGAGFISFHPKGMSFDAYFNFKAAKNEDEKALLFALGFGVGAYHIHYIDPKSINIKEKKGPSVISGIKASSGLVCTACLKSLLWPNEIQSCPQATHIDFRALKITNKNLMFGNRGWIQRLKFWIAKKRYLK